MQEIMVMGLGMPTTSVSQVNLCGGDKPHDQHCSIELVALEFSVHTTICSTYAIGHHRGAAALEVARQKVEVRRQRL